MIFFMDYIKNKLRELEKERGVKILFAAESGSRAWGFPSADSDYDVRFVYTRYKEDYLSVEEYRDVIETPLIQDDFLGVPFDLNGWDLKKALRLGAKSNPVLIEWLVSPIKYIESPEADKILAFAKQAASLQALQYHYHRLAQNSWEQIQQNPENVKVKLYCYALRPALALEWMKVNNAPPPMDIASLANNIDKNLQDEIGKLVAIKSKSKEADVIQSNHLLNEFISSVLESKIEKTILDDSDNIKSANKLFVDFLAN